VRGELTTIEVIKDYKKRKVYVMDKEFEIAIKFVLKWEGCCYSNDPHDPGLGTKYGISKKSYPNEDIKNMTLERAKQIYYQNYWLKQDCDKIPFPLNYCIFNAGVNCGINTAKYLLLASQGNWKDFIIKQIEYYSSLKNFKYFGRGWINRTINLYDLIRKEEKTLK
jgi:lysozyme family protein